MKKIGIMTMHSSHNYGAVLQAYAFQAKLDDMGYYTEIIDYITSIGRRNKELLLSDLSVGSFVHNLRTLMRYNKRKIKHNKFESFIKSFMKLTERSYSSLEELNRENFDYDCVITGSDQTFNLRLGGSRDDRLAYYLPFIKNTKKISYASSFGEHLSKFTDEDIEYARKRLSEYSALSLREESGASFVNRITGMDTEITVDPTMLLTKEEWEDVLTDKSFFNGEYILYYSVLADSWSVNEVKRLSKATKLPVVAPHLKNRFELFADFVRADDSGPREFIGLIKNAKFICTTSFHGTVFSILFNKPFYALKYGPGERLSTLLKTLNLTDRLVNYGESVSIEKMFDISFENANDIMQAERQRSVEFLKNALNGGDN